MSPLRKLVFVLVFLLVFELRIDCLCVQVRLNKWQRQAQALAEQVLEKVALAKDQGRDWLNEPSIEKAIKSAVKFLNRHRFPPRHDESFMTRLGEASIAYVGGRYVLPLGYQQMWGSPDPMDDAIARLEEHLRTNAPPPMADPIRSQSVMFGTFSCRLMLSSSDCAVQRRMRVMMEPTDLVARWIQRAVLRVR